MLTETSPVAQIEGAARRWVCLDVGETLIDETRVWSVWADVLGIPRLTLMAAVGATIVQNRELDTAFSLLGVPDWRTRIPEVDARYQGFQRQDLYPDALPALAALAAAGYGVAVIANQPAHRHGELAALGVDPEVMAMSEAMGVAKPDPAFFIEALRLLGGADPADVAYVGDRTDNDVVPAAAAGLRPVRIRRGPWGLLQGDPDGLAVLTVPSLDELVARIDEAW
ncbi:MAG TPA: HAD family hydrolase [Egibacteraceae bacterium]|nr:HAD family hydrolase [Egibacteraceae bacterium]